MGDDFINILNKILKIKHNKTIEPPEPIIPDISENDITNLEPYDKDWQKYIKYYEERCIPSRKTTAEITLIVISDTHNQLSAEAAEKLIPITNKGVDACLLLGDISLSDMYLLSKILPLDKTYGVLGNHDTFSLYDKNGIKNINTKAVLINNGIYISGMQGSIKYKVWEHPSFTQKESILAASKTPPSDILITHDIPYLSTRTCNIVHKGLVGITKYLFDNQVPINIHGHLHEDSIEILPNNTISIGVYGISIIKIRDGEPSIEKIPFKQNQ